MKKSILLISFLLISTSYAEYSYTSIKRANDNSKYYTSDELSEKQKINIYGYKVNGTVFNVSKYSSHTRVNVNNDDGKRIVLSLRSNRNVKDGNSIYGTCHKKKSGKYTQCNVTIRK